MNPDGVVTGPRSFTTGTEQKIANVHPKTADCKKHGCAIHAPTDHSMRTFPNHWRDDRRMMERICPHGVGHPDPDHIRFVARTRGEEAARVEGVHGCDGCCGKGGDVGSDAAEA